MKPGTSRMLFFAAAMAAAAAAGADESGTVIRASALQKTASADSDVLAQIPEQTTVMVGQRQGAWLQIKWTQPGESKPTVGWVRLLSVRTAPGAGQGDSGLTQAFNIARGSSSGSAVATGVRGLSKGQVEAAQPNFAEAAKLNAWTVSAADALAFAQTPPPPLLQAKVVPYVDENGATIASADKQGDKP